MVSIFKGCWLVRFLNGLIVWYLLRTLQDLVSSGYIIYKLSWLFLASSHIKTCFLTRHFLCDGCWQINYLWHFPSLCLPWSCLAPGRYSWLEWNGLLVTSLQNLDMRSNELVLNCLARLWAHDQLYSICCILAECWSFNSVICIVCCFFFIISLILRFRVTSNKTMLLLDP